MNLPADDHTGQGAEGADAPAAESAGEDLDGADLDGADADGDTGPVAAADDGGGIAAAAPPAAAGAAGHAVAQRTATRRVLDKVFGDVLPTVTRDELDDGSDRSSGERDQWYRDNRPPHHG